MFNEVAWLVGWSVSTAGLRLWGRAGGGRQWGSPPASQTAAPGGHGGVGGVGFANAVCRGGKQRCEEPRAALCRWDAPGWGHGAIAAVGGQPPPVSALPLTSEGAVWAKPPATQRGVHPAAGRARSTATAPRLSVPLAVLASCPCSCQLLVINCITAN